MPSYATICTTIKLVLGATKIPFDIKKKAQAANNLLEWGEEYAQVLCHMPPYSSDQCSLSF